MTPPTTFGVFRIVKSVRPGSIRSGDIARWKSVARRQPGRLEDRSEQAEVVPGYVVDSSTTTWPGRRRSAMLAAADRMYDVSGSRFCVSGVGTQMMIAPTSRTASKSVVAPSSPSRTSGARSSDGTSPT